VDAVITFGMDMKQVISWPSE